MHADARRTFLADINGARAGRRLEPLRENPALDTLAQSRAEKLLASGTTDSQPLAGDKLYDRAKAFGYDARFIAEMIVEAEDDDGLGGVASAWSEGNGGREMILRHEIRDLGVGVGRSKGTGVYVFLFALSQGEFFAKSTEQLSDLEGLRRAMLSRVNEERRKTRRPPLRVNPHLERAAQRHAEDMLARAFYGHQTPEGLGPFQRAAAAGYRPASVAENIAQGQYSLEEVMDGWMKSEPHRRDILGRFSEVGFGFARGKNREGYQVIWVQVFGQERP